MGSVNQLLYQILVLLVGTFWFSISTYLLPLFRFIGTYLFRFNRNDRSLKNNPNYSETTSEENNKEESNCTCPEPKLEAKQDVIDFADSGEKVRPSFCFQFKFPGYEEFNQSNEEPEVVSFNVKELNINTNGCSFGEKDSMDDRFLWVKDFMRVNSEAEAVHEEIPENSTHGVQIEAMEFKENKRKMVNAESKLQVDQHDSDEVQFHSEKDSFAMDSDSESISLNHLLSVTSPLIDSYGDEFLSDGDFGGEFELDSLMLHDKMSDSDENQLDILSTGHKPDDSVEEDSDIMEELRKLEEAHLQNFGTFHSEFLSQKDFQPDLDIPKNEEFGGRHGKTRNGSDNSVEPNSKNSSALDSEDSNKLETLWEHQELIEQLKMELRKVRATGLPTILEESESPKMMEDLKPWKIDEQFQHEHRMDELHKFYKSYRERMRKIDILNYQKMYAIGFLQLKDPLQSISSQKSSVPSITSLFSQHFYLWKRKKSETDPVMKFIKELQSDLEVVYVGQMCLSWEFLHWQYGEALELWESDPPEERRYNEVAGEFQQFQVLMQRFIEDEPFQGPTRVQNYVKSRCVLRDLLQVPVIREDSSKDGKKARRREKDDYAIASDMLVEIIEESIRIFWRFVRTDKDCTNGIVKGQRGARVELHDPADSELFMEVRKNLQKKERKLKVLLRSGNCILRKLRKCEEDSSDHVLCFFSQVDMKLVSRVLNMSKITRDQLVWCRNKLNKISIVNRKLHVEPSFLLFPS